MSTIMIIIILSLPFCHLILIDTFMSIMHIYSMFFFFLLRKKITIF